jgi:enamine deaminase RidA (YjgF/YER057c/UK114 family)
MIATLSLKELSMSSSADKRLQELGLTLPPAPKPVGKYKTVLQAGNFLFLSGHGPMLTDGKLIVGKVGSELTTAQGKEAARQTGLAVLSTLRNHLGSLDRVKQLVKTFGLVNCTVDFMDQPLVLNGFSELMAQVFGDDNGVGVRSAVGANALPRNMAVEVECVFEVVPKS